MAQYGPPPGLYGLRCLHCGSALDLPHDPRLLHIDCPYCGTDNVLPPALIEARHQQYAIDLEHQRRAHAAAEQAAASRRKGRSLLILLLGFGLFGLTLFGSCVAIGYVASQEDKRQAARARDPKVNGTELVVARLNEMRAEKRCDRILVQPTQHHNEDGSMSLDMIAGADCVHVIAATGSGSPVTLSYTSGIALTQPMPVPAPLVDYRLCASATGAHAFSARAGVEPFTVAAIECPRSPSEGGSRTNENDPLATGKMRVGKLLDDLADKGCKHVVAEPAVSRGPQSFTLTSPANGPCYNMVIASHFPDVKFDVSLLGPSGKELPVPKAASEMRVSYCSSEAGKYTLAITPSTGDHFAHASVDCPRERKAARRR